MRIRQVWRVIECSRSNRQLEALAQEIDASTSAGVELEKRGRARTFLVADHPRSDLIDFEEFSIPFDGAFDVIVCNHMFNHAVRLDRFLEVVWRRLRPGGHLYLYNEIDDSEFLGDGQSMIATMNPLHLRAADRPSLIRALAARRFEPVFVKARRKRHMCLVRKVDAAEWSSITRDELERRVSAYRDARDRAVLRVPEHLRSRFAGQWTTTVERAVASGVARFDDDGALRLVK